MYEPYYGFSTKPFSLLPDPYFLYLSEKHRKVLNMMEYGIMNMNAGYTVITGEIGSGKTTLIRRLLKQTPLEYTLGVISNTHKAYGELLQWILMAFDLSYKRMEKAERYETFIDFLIENYTHEKRTVLIIDEAQNMTAEMLEELRTLSNVNVDNSQILQLILVGQPELRNTLQDPRLEQFAQRVTVSHHLQNLDRRETRDYIRHRIKLAGGDPTLFENQACLAVWYFSKGVPRLINAICDQALVYGYADEKPKIDIELIKDVMRDRHRIQTIHKKYSTGNEQKNKKPKLVHS